VRKRRPSRVQTELDGAIEPPAEDKEDGEDPTGFLEGLHAKTRERPDQMEEGFDEPIDIEDPCNEQLFMDERPEQ